MTQSSQQCIASHIKDSMCNLNRFIKMG